MRLIKQAGTEHAQVFRKMLGYSWQSFTQFHILVVGKKTTFHECAEYVSFLSIWLVGFLGRVISEISTLQTK